MVAVGSSCAKCNQPAIKGVISIKGPGFRLRHDVRRVWKCPQCRRRRKTDGHVIAQRCNCTKQRVWMQLIEMQQGADAAQATAEQEPAPDARSSPDAKSTTDAQPAAIAEEEQETHSQTSDSEESGAEAIK